MASKEPKKKKPAKKEKKTETATKIEPEAGEEVDPAFAEPEAVEAPESAEEGEGAAKRGRAVKEPPPPKNWRVEGLSPEGIRVILGRFVTREEAEPELERLKEDGFYQKVRLVEAADASK